MSIRLIKMFETVSQCQGKMFVSWLHQDTMLFALCHPIDFQSCQSTTGVKKIKVEDKRYKMAILLICWSQACQVIFIVQYSRICVLIKHKDCILCHQSVDEVFLLAKVFHCRVLVFLHCTLYVYGQHVPNADCFSLHNDVCNKDNLSNLNKSGEKAALKLPLHLNRI